MNAITSLCTISIKRIPLDVDISSAINHAVGHTLKTVFPPTFIASMLNSIQEGGNLVYQTDTSVSPAVYIAPFPVAAIPTQENPMHIAVKGQKTKCFLWDRSYSLMCGICNHA